ncbi:hypothetical protein FACS1894102_4280 [Spirochaetia bacterium]|nr:hypothetical protein FACS1894102_4280 [Spirochaetia bacterium]
MKELNKNKKKHTTTRENIAAIIIAAIAIFLSMIFFASTGRFQNAEKKGIPLPVIKNSRVQDTDKKQKPNKKKQNKKSEDKSKQNKKTEDKIRQNSVTEIAALPKIPEQPEPPQTKNGKIIFMLDDAGNNLAELTPILKSNYPLTISVLPGLPNSVEAAKRIRRAGKTLFLHQPMEAVNGQNPGPCAIYTGFSRQEVFEILKQNIEQIGPVTGINNHQGSKITTDKNIMSAVLDFCRENDLIFVDSRTTADTVVPSIAMAKNIKIVERSIFLDNDPSPESIQKQINLGIKLVGEKDYVVMIGHTWSHQLPDILKRNYNNLKSKGYEFSTIK